MKTSVLMLAAASALTLAACGGTTEAPADTTTDETAMPAEEGAVDTAGDSTIVTVAQGNPDFSTLVAAVTSAGLGETLSGTGPFTVFAPTNAAFEKIPQADRDALMTPAQRETLSGILTYHVVAGRVSAADLTRQITEGGGSATLTTVNGATLTARVVGDNVVLTDGAGGTSTVTATDVAAGNGVIHAIDTVLMPE